MYKGSLIVTKPQRIITKLCSATLFCVFTATKFHSHKPQSQQSAVFSKYYSTAHLPKTKIQTDSDSALLVETVKQQASKRLREGSGDKTELKQEKTRNGCMPCMPVHR